jgi:hypothetical protein
MLGDTKYIGNSSNTVEYAAMYLSLAYRAQPTQWTKYIEIFNNNKAVMMDPDLLSEGDRVRFQIRVRIQPKKNILYQPICSSSRGTFLFPK